MNPSYVTISRRRNKWINERKKILVKLGFATFSLYFWSMYSCISVHWKILSDLSKVVNYMMIVIWFLWPCADNCANKRECWEETGFDVWGNGSRAWGGDKLFSCFFLFVLLLFPFPCLCVCKFFFFDAS